MGKTFRKDKNGKTYKESLKKKKLDINVDVNIA